MKAPDMFRSSIAILEMHLTKRLRHGESLLLEPQDL
jgi:hypothetical protein